MNTEFGAVAATLSAFYSSFGVRAWTEENVPATEDDGTPLQPPYITYTLVMPTWRGKTLHQARVWTRSESNVPLMELTGKVLEAIGDGVTLDAVGADGYVTIDPGEPLVQMQPMDDPLYKVSYINLELGAVIAQKGAV